MKFFISGILFAGISFAQTVRDIPPWMHRAPDRPQHTVWIEGEAFDQNDNGIIIADTNAYGGRSWAPHAAHANNATNTSLARYSFSITVGGQYLISIAERNTGTNARAPSPLHYSLDLTARSSIPASSVTVQSDWKHLMLADFTRGPHTLHVYASPGSADAVDAIAILREPFTVISMPLRVRAAPMGLFTNAPLFAPRGYAPPRPLMYRILDRKSNEIACGGWLFASELRIPDVPIGGYTAVITEGSNAPLSIPFARVDPATNAYLLSVASADAASPGDIIAIASHIRAAVRIRFDATNTADDVSNRAHPFIAKKLPLRIAQSVPIFIQTNGQYDIASYYRFAYDRAKAYRGIDTWEFIYDAPAHHWDRRAIELALALGGKGRSVTAVCSDIGVSNTGAILADGTRAVLLMPKAAPASPAVMDEIILAVYPRYSSNASRVKTYNTNFIDIAVWNCSSGAKNIVLSNGGAHPSAFIALIPSMSQTNYTISVPTNVHSNIVILGKAERMLAPLIIPVRELSVFYRR
ncbi:MAG: hypothetical protein AABZ39_11310 [Spirochaetota bacterium]